MNVWDSECSSGCESGWTLYLEQSFYSPNNASHKPSGFFGNSNGGFCDVVEHKKKALSMEEEEEDLSMVSDASSGPPHFHEELVVEEEEEDYDDEEAMLNLMNDNKPCLFNSKNTITKCGKRQKMKQQHFSCGNDFVDQEDDTASSPLSNMDFIGPTNNNNNNNQRSVEGVLDYSQGFSATHFQRRRPAIQDPFGFLQSSSISRNQPHEISDLKGIRRWK